MTFTYGSLCTGIRGLDLAVEAYWGAEPAWHSEIEPAAVTVMERTAPGVPNLRDLTSVDWSTVEPVEIITAGYPCQPFSHAGKRKGADDPRHLWPYIAECVRVLRPRWLVLENVAGHLGLGFDRVLGDLAEAGFDAEWCVLRASDVGAPHRRARLFIVAANTTHLGHERGGQARRGGLGLTNGRHADADPDSERLEGRSAVRSGGRERSVGADGLESPADTEGTERRATQREAVGTSAGSAAESGERAGESADGGEVDWGQYGPAIDRWAAILGRPASHPVDDRGRLSPGFVEWMMGYPAGWVDGLTRTQALKALGNAVVTRQALAALHELVPALEAA